MYLKLSSSKSRPFFTGWGDLIVTDSNMINLILPYLMEMHKEMLSIKWQPPCYGLHVSIEWEMNDSCVTTGVGIGSH